jgi:hypothetical protein
MADSGFRIPEGERETGSAVGGENSQAAMTAIVADEGLVASNVKTSVVRAAAQSCREILAGAQIAIQPLAGIDAYLEGVGRELGAR